MTTEDGEGVMLVPEPTVEAEGAQQQILAERGMKHLPPDIRRMTRGRMSDEMVGILQERMDFTRMTEEVAEFWLKYEIEEAGGEMNDADAAEEYQEQMI